MAERYIVCNAELSKIISFDSIKRSVNDRLPGKLLRPIVIDGPLIGVSYDQKYSLDERISSCRNYIRRPPSKMSSRRGFETTTPYPVQALVKILFHFIARGHKVTAFLPLFFNDRLEQACASSCTTVSEVEHFRELVRLKLIRFLPGENFANHLKHRTAKCLGILITTQEAFYFNNALRSRIGDGSNTTAPEIAQSEQSGDGTSGAATATTTVAAGTTASDSFDLMYSSTMVPEMSLGKGKQLPVIIPLFRPYNHRLIISLDVIRWEKVLEVDIDEVTVAQYNDLLAEQQLTLQMQLELLQKLSGMLDNDGFPCGPQDAKIVPLLRHAADLAIEAQKRSSTTAAGCLGKGFGIAVDTAERQTKKHSPKMWTAPIAAQNLSRSFSSSESDENS